MGYCSNIDASSSGSSISSSRKELRVSSELILESAQVWAMDHKIPALLENVINKIKQLLMKDINQWYESSIEELLSGFQRATGYGLKGIPKIALLPNSSDNLMNQFLHYFWEDLNEDFFIREHLELLASSASSDSELRKKLEERPPVEYYKRGLSSEKDLARLISLISSRREEYVLSYGDEDESCHLSRIIERINKLDDIEECLDEEDAQPENERSNQDAREDGSEEMDAEESGGFSQKSYSSEKILQVQDPFDPDPELQELPNPHPQGRSSSSNPPIRPPAYSSETSRSESPTPNSDPSEAEEQASPMQPQYEKQLPKTANETEVDRLSGSSTSLGHGSASYRASSSIGIRVILHNAADRLQAEGCQLLFELTAPDEQGAVARRSVSSKTTFKLLFDSLANENRIFFKYFSESRILVMVANDDEGMPAIFTADLSGVEDGNLRRDEIVLEKHQSSELRNGRIEFAFARRQILWIGMSADLYRNVHRLVRVAPVSASQVKLAVKDRCQTSDSKTDDINPSSANLRQWPLEEYEGYYVMLDNEDDFLSYRILALRDHHNGDDHFDFGNVVQRGFIMELGYGLKPAKCLVRMLAIINNVYHVMFIILMTNGQVYISLVKHKVKPDMAEIREGVEVAEIKATTTELDLKTPPCDHIPKREWSSKPKEAHEKIIASKALFSSLLTNFKSAYDHISNSNGPQVPNVGKDEQASIRLGCVDESSMSNFAATVLYECTACNCKAAFKIEHFKTSN